MKREDQLALKKVKYEGKIYPTNSYGDVVVLEYINSRDVTIRFLNTGNIRKTATSELRKGEIRDNESFPVYKVGVMDIPNELRRCYPVPKEYSIWNGIRQRCYNENTRDKLPTYKDVEMSENFKFYSYFKEWCNQQVGFNEYGWQLDKDLLSKECKIYSEHTCVFVPPEINGFLLNGNSYRGDLPLGVILDKGAKKPRYRARLSKYGKYYCYGSYSNPTDAFYAYKQAKEDFAKELAEKWKAQIDPRVYNALMNYQVEITD